MSTERNQKLMQSRGSKYALKRVTLVLSSPEEARRLVLTGLLSGKTFRFEFESHLKQGEVEQIWVALIFAARNREAIRLLSDLIHQVPENLRDMAILAFGDSWQEQSLKLQRITWWERLWFQHTDPARLSLSKY